MNVVSQEAESASETRRRSQPTVSRLIVTALTVAAALAGAFAGCHPTGTPVVDPIETAAFAAGFTVLCSRASRGTWLVLGVGCVLLARRWLLVPAVGEVLLAFVAALLPRSRRRLGALVGALGAQVLLRWPPTVVHGLPSLAAGVLVVLVGVSAWRRSGRRARRRALWVLGGLAAAAVAVSTPVVVAALSVRSQALAAERSARAALTVIGTGSQASATADLRAAAVDARQADASIDWWLTGGARAIPILAQQERYLAGALSAAGKAAAVGAREAPAVDYHRLGYHHGQIDLDRLTAMVRPMSALAGQLVATDRQLGGLGSPWLLAPLQDHARSFRRDVASARRSAQLAVQAARVLPGILGGSGTRTYLVAFMTPSESRGYDGFIGSYGLLTANDGRVRLTVSGSIADIEQALPEGGAHLNGPVDYLARYGAFHPGEFPQDATYSPDFPTVASVLNQIWAQAAGAPVDGVLAVDPYGLADLLHFTGPVSVPGLPFPLTQENAAEVLLKEQYTTFDNGETNENVLRHDFLQGALHSAFQALVNGSLPAPRSVSTVLDPAVVDGRISFWSFHRSEQPFLRELGIDGSFPRLDNGVVQAVTLQNTGNNKIDAYLHTDVNDLLSFDPGSGDVSSTVRITLRNTAPPSGLPPIVIDSPADPGLPAGSNRTWLTLYSPLSFTRATVDGRATTMSTTPELGLHAYSVYVDVPPEGLATVEVRLRGAVRPGTALPVALRLQPSVSRQRVSVEVTADGAWQLVGSAATARWTADPSARQERTFEFVHL